MPDERRLPCTAADTAACKCQCPNARGAGQVLLDGHPSVNFVAMYSLDGQGADRNVFSNTWSHYVAKPKSTPLKVVGAAFHLSLPLISGQPAGRCACLLGSRVSRPAGRPVRAQLHARSASANSQAWQCFCLASTDMHRMRHEHMGSPGGFTLTAQCCMCWNRALHAGECT